MPKADNISQVTTAQYPVPGQAGNGTVYLPEHYHEPEKSGWKDAVKVIALGLGVTALTVLVVTKLVKKGVSNAAHNKTMSVDAYETKAKQLKMAFDNDGYPGTDEISLRRTLTGIVSMKEYDEVVKAYKRLYDRNLNKDMEEELTYSEYQEMLYILASKPGQSGTQAVSSYDAWAKRLRAAMEEYYIGFWPATDEDAIYSVFNEIPSYASYQKVEQAYQRIYGTNLYDDLCGELWYWEVDDLIEKVKNKH